MRRAFKWLFGALALVVLAAVGFAAWYVFGDRAPAKPKLAANPSSCTSGPATPNGTWAVKQTAGVFVGYRIKELFGDAIVKRDAAGRTKTVAGTLTIATGHVTKAVVTADVTKLDSGRAARDTYILDNALETTKFPTARFTLSAPIALPQRVAKCSTVHVPARGTLLLHGVTRPVALSLDARWNGTTIAVVGSAPVVLRDFGIDAPDTPIAKVDDHGSLELDLEFVPGAL